MSWRRAQKHNIQVPQARFAHVGDGALVLSDEFVEVESNDYLVRSQPGMCRCSLCRREFLNVPRVRKLHLSSKTHLKKLAEVSRGDRQAKG